MAEHTKNRKISFIKNIKHILEASFVHSWMFIFRILPYPIASNIGSLLGSLIIPRLKVFQIAKNNLLLSFNNLKKHEIEDIALQMCDNLGRVAGEFPHISNMNQEKFSKIVKVIGEHNLDKLKDGGLIFTAHIANWEFITKYFSYSKYKSVGVYRKANNPYVENIIKNERAKSGVLFIPKGPMGAKKIIEQIKKKRIITMLLDQKMNNGIAIPFFNRKAMTASAIANLALKYKLPIMGLQVIRNSDNTIILKFHEPLELELTNNKLQDEYNIMLQINQNIEKWIQENPEQWFWVHNRWGNTNFQN